MDGAGLGSVSREVHEPSVITGELSAMRLSARNQIPATITAITLGEATANVELDAGGVRLVASITVEAARELGLAKGTAVTAVIKASDVIVAVQLSPVTGRARG